MKFDHASEPSFSEQYSYRLVKTLPWYEPAEATGTEILETMVTLGESFNPNKRSSYETIFDDAFREEIGNTSENEEVEDLIEDGMAEAITQIAHRTRLGHFVDGGYSLKGEWPKYGREAGMEYAEGLKLDYGDWLADQAEQSKWADSYE